tara:strand:+ start:191 stop:1003 length:813 start_codon:yes stop_codon:yes gene_type:complete
MKWFKHHSDASSDEFISDLEDRFGLLGYARWWKLLEVIAAQMDETDKCSLEYSWKKWGKFLKTNQNILKTFLKHCENNSKIILTEVEGKVKIEIPKLLEIRDNHTKNKQATNKPLASDLALEVEVEVEVDKDKDKEVDIKHKVKDVWFDEDWASYPRKAGSKSKAKKCYLKSVTSLEKRDEFCRKTKLYITNTDPVYLKHGETWFRNWEDHAVAETVIHKSKEDQKFDDKFAGINKFMARAIQEEADEQNNICKGDRVSDSKQLNPSSEG